MIGSFWNLCRACPSMPVDKLHSEYRSTYKWHEYTGPRQEVVRRPPQSQTSPPAANGTSANGNTSKLRPTRSTEEESTTVTSGKESRNPSLAYDSNEVRDILIIHQQV
ncbi:uncharacterized protein LOC126471056 [Schistocerca serialis cubense]|uniref:uncharacterized protein LOC126471056 n=1 Tax=Schistocerca serialis cubense TaxID=2023355 RepID=UPI00214E8C05|nr:uncharacterized protein LOC126471056 [Schistocerca serialis cubense]